MRKKKRASKIWVFLLLLIILAGAGYAGYTYLVVQNVEVVGNGVISADEVKALADIPMGRNLFLVDMGLVKSNLKRSPFIIVNDLSIRLPDTVVIDISVRQRMAMVQYVENQIFIDDQGYILEVQAGSGDMGYISIEGLNVTAFSLGEVVKTADPAQVTALTAVLDPLYAFELENDILSVDLQNTNHIYMETREGIKVVLGSAENMESKMRWVASILPELTGEGYTTGTLNVTTDTPSFLPDSETTPPVETGEETGTVEQGVVAD